MNFMLESQRSGQLRPFKSYFTTREGMQAAIARHIKNHFIGILEPYVLDKGLWFLDEESLALMRSDHALEQNIVLAEAAEVFKRYSLQKTELSGEQKEELGVLLSSITDMLYEEEEVDSADDPSREDRLTVLPIAAKPSIKHEMVSQIFEV